MGPLLFLAALAAWTLRRQPARRPRRRNPITYGYRWRHRARLITQEGGRYVVPSLGHWHRGGAPTFRTLAEARRAIDADYRARQANPATRRTGRRMSEQDAPDMFGGWGIRTADTGDDRAANRREAKREMQRYGARDLFAYARDRDRQDNPEFFTGVGGRIHPIRDSDGYDPEVEDVVAEQREHRRLEDQYRHHRADRSDSYVVRPPWAAGISNNELVRIARKYDISPAREAWWDAVGLTGRGRTLSGRVTRASGELRAELEAGQHRSPRRTTSRTASRTATRAAASGSRRRWKEPADLPW